MKVKLSFDKKLFQKEKNKLLLWIDAQQLSGHLWFKGWQIAGCQLQLKPLLVHKEKGLEDEGDQVSDPPFIMYARVILG